MKTHRTLPQIWLYGIHACRMALENPRRQVHAILLANEGIAAKVLLTDETSRRHGPKIRVVDRQRLEALLPAQSVHQGVAIQVSYLPPAEIMDLDNDLSPNQCVIVLDQVSDPHNVGAILRSAAVFGAKAMILTDRHAPSESGALAKSASGALETVPLIRIPNLAHGLKDLKDMGFWCVGFSESGKEQLHQVNLKGRVALVMGGEGEGMRRLTRDLCDYAVCLPSASSAFSTLNVSNAAAIALYETYRFQQAPSI